MMLRPIYRNGPVLALVANWVVVPKNNLGVEFRKKPTPKLRETKILLISFEKKWLRGILRSFDSASKVIRIVQPRHNCTTTNCKSKTHPGEQPELRVVVQKILKSLHVDAMLTRHQQLNTDFLRQTELLYLLTKSA